MRQMAKLTIAREPTNPMTGSTRPPGRPVDWPNAAIPHTTAQAPKNATPTRSMINSATESLVTLRYRLRL